MDVLRPLMTVEASRQAVMLLACVGLSACVVDSAPPGVDESDGTDVEFCDLADWHVTPQLETPRGVSVEADGHLFVPARQAVLHWDGDAWTTITVPDFSPETYDRFLWAESGDVLWISSRHGPVWRWSAGDLELVFPTEGDPPGDFHNKTIWGTDDGIWVGGTVSPEGCAGCESEPFLHVYENESWIEHALPDGAVVKDLWSPGGDELWAATTTGAARFDGDTWQSSPGSEGLVGRYITGNSASDVWLTETEQFGVGHYDGGQWTVVESPGWVVDLWGDGPQSLYGVVLAGIAQSRGLWRVEGTTFADLVAPLAEGSWLRLSGFDGEPILTSARGVHRLHDGELQHWLEIEPEVGVSKAMIATEADEAVVLDGQRLLAFEDGRWRTMVEVDDSFFPGSWNAMAASSLDDVWAVGWHDDESIGAPVVHHWDGEQLTAHNLPAHDYLHLRAASLAPNGDLWVAGVNSLIDAEVPDELEGQLTRVLRHSEGVWEDVSPPGGQVNVSSIATAGTVVMVNGYSGGLLARDSENPEMEWFNPLPPIELGRVRSGPNETIWAFRGDSNDEKVIVRWDGAWETYPLPAGLWYEILAHPKATTNPILLGLHSLPGDDILAGVFTGEQWLPVELPEDMNRGLASMSADGSLILKSDRATWQTSCSSL